MSPQTPSPSEHGLRRQLGLGDLVFAQVLAVVGSAWVGIAAALGSAQTVVWIIAMVSFYLPLAVAVYFLNREMPLEGGLYTWARRAFGDATGFLVAWNLWGYGLTSIATIFSQLPTEFSYMVGPRLAWLPENHALVLAGLTVATALLALSALCGLALGKWIHNISGAAMVLAFTLLIAAPAWMMLHHQAIPYRAVEVALPAASAKNMALIGQVIFAASGLEYIAILAGETRSPQHNISRSVVLASPVIVVMFVLGTSSVLAFHRWTGVPINFVAPIPQTLTLAFGDHGPGAWLSRFAILLLQVRILGCASLLFTGVTRLPMAAGWDHLAPEWLARLHPRFRTPSNSILLSALVVAALLALAFAGVHAAEAFAILNNSSSALYGITYMAMFLIPICGAKLLRQALPRWVAWITGLGFAATFFSVGINAYPFLDVPQPLLFALKVVITVLGFNALGYAFYRGRLRLLAARSSAA